MMLSVSKSTLVVCLVLFTSMVKAEEQKPECATPEEISSIIKIFTIQSNDEVTSNKGLRDCSYDSAMGATLGGIAFMSRFDSLPSLKKSIDQNIIGSSPTRFLVKRAKTIQFVPNYYGSCRPPNETGGYVSAYVHPYYPAIYVCRESAAMDAFEMASVLVHEARHVEGHLHAHCLRGYWKGDAACDERYEDKGSYAVGTEYYLRLSVHPEVSPTLKASARLMGITELWGRFNKYPINFRGQLILQEENGDVSIFDKKKVISQSPQGDAVLVKRGEGHAFIDQQNKTVKSFFADKWLDTSGPLAQNLREGKLDIGSDKIIDIFYGETYSCILTTSKLLCTANLSGVYTNIEIKNITPIGMIYVPSTTLVQSKTLYLVGEDGYLYRLPSDYNVLKSRGESSFTKTKQKYPYKKIVTVPAVAGEFVLTIEGKVLHTPAESKNLKPVKELEGKIFRSIAPVEPWSEELNSFQ